MLHLPKRRFQGIVSLLGSALFLMISGCGGGGGGSGSGPALSLSSAQTKGFTATLSEDKATIPVGGMVTYTLRVTNTSGAAAGLALPPPGSLLVPNVFLQIVNKEGILVYPVQNPGDLPPPVPINGVVTLQPGQSVSEIVPLSVFSAADTYSATAVFQISTSVSDPKQAVTVGPLMVVAQ